MRIAALIKIYKQLGWEITIFYMEQFKVSRTFKGELYRLLFQADIRILFSTAEIDVRGYDYIHYDNLRFFQWKVRRDLHSEIIYNAHNLEFESYYSRDPSWAKQLFKRYEIKTIQQSDYILVCSKRESSILNGAGIKSEKIFIVPNLIDKSAYHVATKKDKILFLGTLDYYPNIRAVEYLCNYFYPQLQKEMPHVFNDYEFVIAGRNPSAAMVEQVQKYGITVRQNLSQTEIYDLLGTTYISLVPLDHGSGTRLKIVESIFSHAFVLSTALGAEGFITNQQIIISTLENFPKSFIQFMRNKRIFNKIDDEFLQENDLTLWCKHNLSKLKLFFQGES